MLNASSPLEFTFSKVEINGTKGSGTVIFSDQVRKVPVSGKRPVSGGDTVENILTYVIDAALQKSGITNECNVIVSDRTQPKMFRNEVNSIPVNVHAPLSSPIGISPHKVDRLKQVASEALMQIGLEENDFSFEVTEMGQARNASHYVAPDRVGVYIDVEPEAKGKIDMGKAIGFLRANNAGARAAQLEYGRGSNANGR